MQHLSGTKHLHMVLDHKRALCTKMAKNWENIGQCCKNGLYAVNQLLI